MQVPSAPKGTRDFYPPEMAFQDYIFDSWRRTCERYGFEHYDGPMFEHLDLFTQKSGAEIEKQLYAFEDKGGRQIALRPELTPTLARMVAAKGSGLKRPIRWYSIPRLFRYEKMQKGRLREFHQLNLDILGVKEVGADAELIAAAVAMMRDLGFTADDFTVRISSRTLLEELLVLAGVAREESTAVYAALDKMHKVAKDEFESELRTICGNDEVFSKVNDILAARSLADIAAINAGIQPYKDLAELFDLLALYGIAEYAEFDIGIVRGLAYYTGIVFEVFDKKRSLRAIAGGGRYDKLVKLYGGPDTPAVGFAAGDVVLAELLKEKGFVLHPKPRTQVFVVAFDDGYPGPLLKAVEQLRAEGISTECALRKCGVGKQLELAHSAGAKLVLFVGGSEAQAGTAKIKSMGSGEELTCALPEVIGRVKELLK